MITDRIELMAMQKLAACDFVPDSGIKLSPDMNDQEGESDLLGLKRSISWQPTRHLQVRSHLSRLIG
jgi:hypothetical protein